MTSVTVDDRMLALFQTTASLAEIRDAQGVLIGFFAPVSLEQSDQYALAAARISPAELQQRIQGGGEHYSIHEVLHHLDELEKS